MYAIRVLEETLTKSEHYACVGYFVGFYNCQKETYIAFTTKHAPDSKNIKLYKSRKRAQNAIEIIKNKVNCTFGYEVEEWK